MNNETPLLPCPIPWCKGKARTPFGSRDFVACSECGTWKDKETWQNRPAPQEIRSEGLVWKLADALMDMVNQYCHTEDGVVDHGCLSSNELALDVLEEMGLATVKNGRLYELNWVALKALSPGFRHGDGLPEPEQGEKK